MTISHVKVLTVPVSDQDRAKQFYAETLGFEVLTDQTVGDNRWLQVAPRLVRDGVAVDGPRELPWGRQATFTDPDGNSMVLQDAAI